jgi:hypothetical protein
MTKTTKIEYEEIWSFSTSYGNHTYDVKWVYLKDSNGDFTYPYLLPFKDGETLSYSAEENNSKVRNAINAAIASRVTELKKEYVIPLTDSDLVRWEKAKDAIESLANRSLDDEYVGQQSSMGLYTQDVSTILDIQEYQIIQLTRELINEKRIGLNGLIYTTFEKYDKSRKFWEEKTGHKNFDRSDMGSWWCHYCGVRGDVQDELQPQDIECAEGKFYESE